MSLGQRIPPGCAATGLEVENREELFAWITERLVDAGCLDEPSAARGKLLERERIMSTAIMPGVAVPHARCEDARSLALVVARLAEGIEFGAKDGQPVRLIFALVGPPSSTAEHVKVLGKVAKLIRDPGQLDALLCAESASTLVDALN